MGEVIEDGREYGWGKLEQNFKINHVKQEKKNLDFISVRSYL